MEKILTSPSKGQKKKEEADALGFPEWLGLFARQVYDNDFRRPKIKKKELTFSEQWDQEIEEIRKFLL
jgi:hypothetical protein